jgi:hypothetical protein
MTILERADLEFAKAHIQRFYDSDFFPKPVDFQCLWHSWDEVVSELTAKNVPKLVLSTPRVMAAPKPTRTFRLVHQLEPLDSLVYTALASAICEQVESARPPVEENVACSYRIKKEEGNFFASDSGWEDFTSQTETLAIFYDHVLNIDISDFYNQIYLHRLQNAIEIADPSLADIADDIEKFLTSINSKVSQGIPVGPAASIIFAEAVLLDVDSFISSLGVAHTRYVDDFRIFANDRATLEEALERITLYLYEAHRLSLATEKTSIIDTGQFLAERIHSAQTEERDEILDTLGDLNPYGASDNEDEGGENEEGDETPTHEDDSIKDPWDGGDFHQDQTAETASTIVDAATDLEAKGILDLAVARALIRAARRNGVVELARKLLGSLCFYAPVASDVFIYLDKITDEVFATAHASQIVQALETDCSKRTFLKYWMGWYLANHITKFNDSNILSFVRDSDWLEIQAIAAVNKKDLAWVRSKKNGISNYSPRERRAIMYAGRILPGDEKEAWLRNVMNNSATKMDNWMAKWVLSL